MKILKMKPTQIIKEATDAISEDIRTNYVYGNMFLADVIGNYVADIKSGCISLGIFHQKNKMDICNMVSNVSLYWSKVRSLMGEYAYRHTPYMLEHFDEEFGKHLKVLFYSVKRELDKVKPHMSYVLANITMVYMLSSLEINRTQEYAKRVQEASNIGMNAVYDQCIVSVRNISVQLMKRLADMDVSSMNPKEISMAFSIFSKELNDCKIKILSKE